jgi:anti-sigma regulatory factor (Ser/Thr protein kinase)
VENEELVLEVPAVPAYIGTARLFIGAVARHVGASEEQVDDLKVAVSEACTAAIRTRADAGNDGPVRVLVDLGDGRLTVEVPDAIARRPDRGAANTDELARELSAEIIRALFPQAETRSPNGIAPIRFWLDLG